MSKVRKLSWVVEVSVEVMVRVWMWSEIPEDCTLAALGTWGEFGLVEGVCCLFNVLIWDHPSRKLAQLAWWSCCPAGEKAIYKGHCRDTVNRQDWLSPDEVWDSSLIQKPCHIRF